MAAFTSLKVQCAWEDEAYAAQFYDGLKDLIKDKISREEQLIGFITIAEKVLRIN